MKTVFSDGSEYTEKTETETEIENRKKRIQVFETETGKQLVPVFEILLSVSTTIKIVCMLDFFRFQKPKVFSGHTVVGKRTKVLTHFRRIDSRSERVGDKHNEVQQRVASGGAEEKSP